MVENASSINFARGLNYSDKMFPFFTNSREFRVTVDLQFSTYQNHGHTSQIFLFFVILILLFEPKVKSYIINSYY